MKFRHLKLSHIFMNLKRLLSVSFLPQFIKNFNFEKHITATLLHKRVINKIISKLVIEKILENRKIPNTHQLKSTSFINPMHLCILQKKICLISGCQGAYGISMCFSELLTCVNYAVFTIYSVHSIVLETTK